MVCLDAGAQFLATFLANRTMKNYCNILLKERITLVY